MTKSPQQILAITQVRKAFTSSVGSEEERKRFAQLAVEWEEFSEDEDQPALTLPSNMSASVGSVFAIPAQRARYFLRRTCSAAKSSSEKRRKLP